MTSPSQLPRITRYLGAARGESMKEVCAHCGSKGTVVHSFVCEDGTTRQAMSGCIKLFPISVVAAEDMRLREKAREYEAKGWTLNSFDRRMREAIDAHYAGDMPLDEAARRIKSEKARAEAWRANRGRRR